MNEDLIIAFLSNDNKYIERKKDQYCKKHP
jgi:hypothetical protein